MKCLSLTCLSAALTLFGFTSGGVAQTIKVGAVVPLTGRYAALGAQVRTGYEIGVEQTNAAGGVTVGGSFGSCSDPSSVVKPDAQLASMSNPARSVQGPSQPNARIDV